MTPLEEKITLANHAYWVLHNPIMTDAEYDSLIEELRSVDPFNPLLTELNDGTSPVCQHPYPMLSLRKVYKFDDLKGWMASISRTPDELFIIQPKFDGCTCRITDGRLYTRGDGQAGEDITQVLPIVKGITQQDDLGEIIITNEDFTKYCASGVIKRKDGSTFANQRNAVAGLLNRVEGYDNLPKILTFVSYNPTTCPTIDHTSLEIEVMKDMEEIIEWVFSLGYPLDGIVFKVGDLSYSEQLGNTAHHPRGQIAYKFENCSEESEILDIDWQIGRTGIYTPVLKIKPINIHGSNISSVTAHDAKHVKDFQLCIGDKVVISRAGDVIPFLERAYHTEQNKDAEPIIPTVCVHCGKKLVYTATGVDLVCQNPKCPGMRLRRLIYATKSLQMDGWSEQTIRELQLTYDLNLYRLFTLTRDEIKVVFPGKRGDNLFDVKEKVLQSIQPYQVLMALGIPLAGKENSKAVLEIISLEDISDGKLDKLGGCQLRINLQIWLIDKLNQMNLKMILDYLRTHYHEGFGMEVIKTKTEDDQKSVCFTGKMTLPRAKMKDQALLRGYLPTDSVGRTTSLLVTNDKDHVSSKVKKAKDYEIPIMTEEEFMNLPLI